MGHCVYSYLDNALKGIDVILSARYLPKQERCATVNIKVRAQGESGKATLVVDSCLAQHNKKNEHTDTLKMLLDDWLNRVDYKTLNADVLLERHYDPSLQYTSLMPIGGVAPLFAYFALMPYLPGAVTPVDLMIESDPTWQTLYTQSSFKQQVEAVTAVSAKCGVEPTGLVLLAERQGVDVLSDMNVLHSLLAPLLPAYQALSQAVQAHVDPEQRIEAVASMVNAGVLPGVRMNEHATKLLKQNKVDVLAVLVSIMEVMPAWEPVEKSAHCDSEEEDSRSLWRRIRTFAMPFFS